jgi:hypothetical protein
MAATTSVHRDGEGRSKVGLAGPIDRSGVRELCAQIAESTRQELIVDLTEARAVDDATARHLRRRLRRAVGRRDAVVLSDDLDLRMILEAGWPTSSLIVRPSPSPADGTGRLRGGEAGAHGPGVASPVGSSATASPA